MPSEPTQPAVPPLDPGAKPAGPQKAAKGLLWFGLVCLAVVIVAFYTNPDRDSLIRAVNQNIAENQAKAGTLEKLAGDLLVTHTFERRNYYLFSVGTVTAKVRFGGPELRVEVLGAFGHWWFELLNTPLYETGPEAGKKGR